MSARNRFASALVLALIVGTGHAAEPLRTDHLSSQLVAETRQAVRGQTLRLGLHLQHDPNWHTYWRNPGDSGLPTRIALSLPDGVDAGDIQWPAPQRFELSGIVNFGYDERIVLPLEIRLPADLPGESLEIEARASWLICAAECIPGRGEYRLSLPLADAAEADPRWREDFARAQARQPSKLHADARYRVDGERVLVELRGDALPPAIAGWEVFPVTTQLVANAAWPTWSRIAGGFRLALPRSEYFVAAPQRFELLLVQDERALAIDAAHTAP
ncbi:MAG: protein-disulfide reductase DsbD domain-containing protein [Lysobacteraceae bacterium]